jgi:hypothetical protein
MSKKVAATLVFVIIASLSAAGCTVPFIQHKASPLPTPIPTKTHNPALESAANELISAPPPGWVRYDTNVTWDGGSCVTLNFIDKGHTFDTALNDTKEIMNGTYRTYITLRAFATSQDAATYAEDLAYGDIVDDIPFTTNSSSAFSTFGVPSYQISAFGIPSVYQHFYLTLGPDRVYHVYQYNNFVEDVYAEAA